MKYAIIGCGRISPNHVMAAKNNNWEIVAMCDIVKSNAADKILKFDLDSEKIKVYEDYRNMLKNEKPELVAIATETGKHAAITLECIDAGCYVIIEKLSQLDSWLL